MDDDHLRASSVAAHGVSGPRPQPQHRRRLGAHRLMDHGEHRGAMLFAHTRAGGAVRMRAGPPRLLRVVEEATHIAPDARAIRRMWGSSQARTVGSSPGKRITPTAAAAWLIQRPAYPSYESLSFRPDHFRFRIAARPFIPDARRSGFGESLPDRASLHVSVTACAATDHRPGSRRRSHRLPHRWR
jgi:hypothetical protein